MKRTVVADAPSHLLVTMSRFQYNLQRGVREKVCTPVACTTSLHLPVHNNVDVGLPSNLGGDHVIDDDHVTYDLYAVTIHAGSRADHGHYYTFARHEVRTSCLRYCAHRVALFEISFAYSM
ncbi:hypothetical protein AaE_005678 [Aphanomyces astaci]|uniref:USP domain-containing protein n=1 Tax=Aphanomyces astaci TaxID=112090 RepID=A0A6A5AK26_APHAT|nr:hypothetical protein AaE_005678 [Aphanomyces astaci]